MISRLAEENYFLETFVRVERLLSCFCNLKSLLVVKKSSCLSVLCADNRSNQWQRGESGTGILLGAVSGKEAVAGISSSSSNQRQIYDSAIWHSIFSPSKAYAIQACRYVFC